MSQIEKKKKWVFREPAFPDITGFEKNRIVSEIAANFNIPTILASMLFDRGCGSVSEAAAFIHNNYISGRDPIQMKDMLPAVQRINRAIVDKSERVVVFGDYDVDGVTSVSVLYLYLKSRGVNADYYIPQRSEGYGMSRESVDELARRGTTLIITVDTGTTCIDEISYANTLGIDTVVTDHHECKLELPPAVAVINPHRPDDLYPFKELAGVGVAYKLITALEMDKASEEKRDRFDAERAVLLKYADLVAIGTIADVMPLIDENRMLVSFGLQKLQNSPRKGIAALIDASSKKKGQVKDISASFIGFTIAPRLNAAGRMDNASLAVELLLSNNEDKASEIADRLCDINLSRQEEENRIASEAIAMIQGDNSFFDDSVIVLASNNWRQGVIGIVASRLTEKYAKPTILITFEGMKNPGVDCPSDMGKGSGRSVKGMNLVSALSFCDDLLDRYGGHELAAGLSVEREKLPELRKRLNDYAKSRFGDSDFSITYEADKEIEASQITLDLAENIKKILEPCGTGNPMPVFILRDAKIVSLRPISEGRHTKILVEKDGLRFQAIFFGVSPSSMNYDSDDRVDLLFTLSINRYLGETTVQLVLQDISYSTVFFRQRVSDRRSVSEIIAGARFNTSDSYLPDRTDFVNFYGVINDLIRGGRDSFSDQYIMMLMNRRFTPERRINYVKYKLLLAIFAELDLLKVTQFPCVPDSQADEWSIPQDYVSVIKVSHPIKVDLESSVLLTNLRNQCSAE